MNFSIDVFRDMLPIDKHALDSALEVQADVMEKISRIVARMNSASIAAKEELGQVEARLTKEAKEDNAKVTVAEIDATVKQSRERKVVWQAYQRAREEHEEWVGLLAAWTARGYNLKPLGQLFSDQYFSVTTLTHSPTNMRALIREASERASEQRSTTPPRRRPTS